MSKRPVHEQKKSKNFAVLAILFGLIALIWIITMLKIGGATPRGSSVFSGIF